MMEEIVEIDFHQWTQATVQAKALSTRSPHQVTEEVEVDDVEISSKTQWTQAGRQERLKDELLKPFAGRVFIDSHEKGLETARSEYRIIDLTNKLVFWTDASHKFKGRDDMGIAFVWKDQHHDARWNTKQYYIRGDGRLDNDDAEFFAISEAMRVAAQICQAGNQRPANEDAKVSSVVIYTDSQYALRHISSAHASATNIGRSQWELARLKERARVLSNMGVHVELHWVKGHRDVEGNILADKLAGIAANGPGQGVETMLPARDLLIQESQLASIGLQPMTISRMIQERSMARRLLSPDEPEGNHSDNPLRDQLIRPLVKRSDQPKIIIAPWRAPEPCRVHKTVKPNPKFMVGPPSSRTRSQTSLSIKQSTNESKVQGLEELAVQLQSPSTTIQDSIRSGWSKFKGAMNLT